MKQFLLFLFLFVALTARALATDVAIGAMPIDGFSPSSIGNDRAIAVSTAGGSPTVTSSAQFPLAIVGIGGFTVRIDGTLYTVASVASTSSLTLTTNYSGTPGAQTMTLFRYVEMRVYADRAFQPLGSTQVVQPGTVGSSSFFRRFAASVVNNGSTDQLFIPAIVLPATTDALITNQARYTIPLYRPGGSLVQSFFCPSNLAQLRLPPATPTTWTAICSFNSPPAVVPPANVAYTRGEIDFRFPSCSINQAIFYAASGNKQSCLTIGSGLSIAGGVLTAGGAGGYGTIQEEGTPLTQRTILNFIGFGFTAADNAGATRTELSLDPDLNALAAFAGTGFPARTAADTWLLRSLTQPAAGFTITNPAGATGNPTFALANDLGALEGLSGTGFAQRTGVDTWALNADVVTGPASATDNALARFDLTTGKIIQNSAVTAADTTGNFSVPNGWTVSNPGGSSWTLNDVTSVFVAPSSLSASPRFTSTVTSQTQSSGFGVSQRLSTTYNQTATASSTDFDIQRIETTLGSGQHNFFGGLGGPTGSTLRFRINNLGNYLFGASGGFIGDENGNEYLKFATAPSAVNFVQIFNSGTGVETTVQGTGDDANVALKLTQKGSGNLIFDINNTPRITMSGLSVDTYFGNGITAATPDIYRLNATGGSGTNIAGANLEFAGGKGTGNAIPGQVAIKYPLIGASGTTLQSLSASRYPPITNLYTNDAFASTITNTTAESSLFTVIFGAGSPGSTRTIEGGICRTGTSFRTSVFGVMSTTGTPTFRLRAYLGPTLVADTGAIATPNNLSGATFLVDIQTQVFTLGGAATPQQTFIYLTLTPTNGGTPVSFVGGGSIVNFDSTVNRDIDITAQWGTASASNAFAPTSISIDRKR